MRKLAPVLALIVVLLGGAWLVRAAVVDGAAVVDPNTQFVKGVNANLVFWSTAAWGSQGANVAAEARALGVTWTREALNSFTLFDAMLPAARRQGLRVLPVIPNWPNAYDVAGFASFVAASVKRYGPGTRANLTWFELWNEPYFSYSWNGAPPDPAQYARLYDAAVLATRKVNSRARFLVSVEVGATPTTTGNATTWIDDMFKAVPSLGRAIDGISFHAYGDDPALPLVHRSTYQDPTGGWSFARIDTAHQLMLEHGVNRPFWITEVGWSTNLMSAEVQARNYRDLIPQVRARPWIGALFIYNLRDHEPRGTNPLEGFGLERYPDVGRKPAWRVVQAGLAQLG
jgi:hypothetical protein